MWILLVRHEKNQEYHWLGMKKSQILLTRHRQNLKFPQLGMGKLLIFWWVMWKIMNFVTYMQKRHKFYWLRTKLQILLIRYEKIADFTNRILLLPAFIKFRYFFSTSHFYDYVCVLELLMKQNLLPQIKWRNTIYPLKWSLLYPCYTYKYKLLIYLNIITELDMLTW